MSRIFRAHPESTGVMAPGSPDQIPFPDPDPAMFPPADPADSGDSSLYTVGRLVREIRGSLESSFRQISVVGEITNSKSREVLEKASYWYFSIKDDTAGVDAQIACYMSGYYIRTANFLPLNGCKVILKGKATVQEKYGSLRMAVTSMQFTGDGRLKEEFLRLQRKLREEGLFDPALKRPLPLYPRTIGIITSPSGMALGDMLKQITSARFPGKVILYPALVQGISAPSSLSSQLLRANRDGLCDVIIMGRGGGSYEELFCFNDETLVRQVRASRIPVISAVGHTGDHCLCDEAADAFQPTPTAAGAAVVAAYDQLYVWQEDLRKWMTGVMEKRLTAARTDLDRCQTQLQRHSPDHQLKLRAGALRETVSHLRQLTEHRLGSLASSVAAMAVELQRHSPAVKLSAARERLDSRRRELAGAAAAGLAGCRSRLEHATSSLMHRVPSVKLSAARLESQRERLGSAMLQHLRSREDLLQRLSLKLSDLNPLISPRFSRTITLDPAGRSVSSIRDVKKGEQITTVLPDGGRILSLVTGTVPPPAERDCTGETAATREAAPQDMTTPAGDTSAPAAPAGDTPAPEKPAPAGEASAPAVPAGDVSAPEKPAPAGRASRTRKNSSAARAAAAPRRSARNKEAAPAAAEATSPEAQDAPEEARL